MPDILLLAVERNFFLLLQLTLARSVKYWSTCMPRICQLTSPEVNQRDDELRIAFSAVSNLKSGLSHLKKLIGDARVTIPTETHAQPHVLNAHAIEQPGKLFDLDTLDEVAAEFRRTMEAGLSRFARAHLLGQPLARDATDRAILSLNKVIWDASQHDTQWEFFPDSPSSWSYEPIDPATLNCAEPVDVFPAFIDQALVLGVQEIHNHQLGLFDPAELIDIIIWLQHEHPKIRHVMTRAEAQAVWRGATLLSAHVEIEGNGIPTVTNEIELNREA